MLLNKQDIAKFLGVSVPTVTKYINKGLPYYKISDKIIRFKTDEVEAWLKEHRMN